MNGHQRLDEGIIRIGFRRISWNHPNYIMVWIGQNTEKNSGNVVQLPVSQNPMKYHSLSLSLYIYIYIYIYIILNKSWQQHPTRHQLYGHLPPITKSIQVRRTRHAGHCWRSRDELIRDVLLWIPTHGRAKAGRPARTYIQQLCEDTGCCPEDLPRAMNDREEWRERVRDIRAASTIWWWWYIYSNHSDWFLCSALTSSW